MAVLALKTSAFRNAVSALHRSVSQEMFQDLWPRLPVEEVPIISITNGVHAPTWINGDLAMLYDQYFSRIGASVWKTQDVGAGSRDSEPGILGVHRKRKRRMVTFVRERAVESAVQREASAAEVRRLSKSSIRTFSPSVLRGDLPPISALLCCFGT